MSRITWRIKDWILSCVYCHSRFQSTLVPLEGKVMRMTILWGCPVCNQTNKLKGRFSYKPIDIREIPHFAKLPTQGKGDDDDQE